MRLLKPSLAAVLWAALAACSGPPEEPTAMPKIPDWRSLTGSVAYRERIMLSPAATVVIRLEDVSLADASSTLLAEQTIETPGQVPVAFELIYNPKIINPRSTYVVRATIYEGSEMRFVTDTAYPVLTQGTGKNADLMLVAADRGQAKVGSQLLDTQWQLVSINGEVILAGPTGKKPSIRLSSADNTVGGFAGCNNFSAEYSEEDGKLVIGEIAMTMMACMETMELESNYVASLRASDAFKIQERQLRTYTADGEELLIFEAQN